MIVDKLENPIPPCPSEHDPVAELPSIMSQLPDVNQHADLIASAIISASEHISSSILHDLGRTLWRLTLAVESVAIALKESK